MAYYFSKTVPAGFDDNFDDVDLQNVVTVAKSNAQFTSIQEAIDQGATPHIGWQILAYVVLTSAEVMISITCLEYSYTQAPTKMKSFIMAFFMMSVAIGNLFTSGVNFFIENEDGSSKLAGSQYFWFFTMVMLFTASLFVFAAKRYKEKTYLQHD